MSRAMWDSDGVTSSVTRSVTSGDVIIGDVTIHLSHLAVVGIQRMNEEKEEGRKDVRCWQFVSNVLIICQCVSLLSVLGYSCVSD